MLRKILVGYVFLILVVMGCRAVARSQPTPTPTKTPRPTFTPTSAVTPMPVVMATATPWPTDTPVPPTPTPLPPTDTLTPTRPPARASIIATPTPEVDFKIVKQEMRRPGRPNRCDGLPEIELRVLDKNGEPLDHVRLEVYWFGGRFFKNSGWLGPGYDKATLTSGTFWVRVTGGEPPYDDHSYTSELTRPLSTDKPTREDLEKAGYCQPGGECADCIVYSYEVVFQRQW